MTETSAGTEPGTYRMRTAATARARPAPSSTFPNWLVDMYCAQELPGPQSTGMTVVWVNSADALASSPAPAPRPAAASPTQAPAARNIGGRPARTKAYAAISAAAPRLAVSAPVTASESADV